MNQIHKICAILILLIGSCYGFCHEQTRTCRSRTTRKNILQKPIGEAVLRTRGGSLTELKVFDHVHATVGAVNKFYVTFPILSSLLTCGLKASAADYFAQQVSMGAAKPEYSSSRTIHTSRGGSLRKQAPFRFELTRNLSFLLYGALYQGLFQHFLYNEWFPKMFGSEKDILTIATQLAFDTAIVVPSVCWPLAYVIKSIVNGDSLKDGMVQYIDDLKNSSLVKNFVLIWIPAKALIFGLVPEHLKIASIAFVSFFWTMIFSSICGKVKSS